MAVVARAALRFISYGDFLLVATQPSHIFTVSLAERMHAMLNFLRFPMRRLARWLSMGLNDRLQCSETSELLWRCDLAWLTPTAEFVGMASSFLEAGVGLATVESCPGLLRSR